MSKLEALAAKKYPILNPHCAVEVARKTALRKAFIERTLNNDTSYTPNN